MRLFVTTLVITLLASSCFIALDHEGVALAERDTFIALQSDFAGYTSWPSLDVTEESVDAVHTGTTGRRAYINVLPGEGDVAFAVGTIIVKTGAGGELTGDTGTEVHAMVKRGNAFNPDGARGWEWFELDVDDDPNASADVIEPGIVWRGFAPPDGHGYGCTVGADCDEAIVDCNGCHLDSIGNDYVHTFALP
jgi:hypothetical protein